MVAAQSSVDEGVELEINVEVEARSNEWAEEAASKAATMTIVAGDQDVDEDLDGKTTINHKETETLRSTSDLTGKCSRRLTSTA